MFFQKLALRAAGLALLAPFTVFSQTFVPSQDAYVVPGNASNFGSAVNLTTGSSNSQGLVQFDLSSLPAAIVASQVQRASLILYVNHVGSAGTINIYEANGSWAETTVNGDSPPVPGAVVAASVPVSTAGQFITVDVTTAVQDWITNPGTNAGFLIAANGSASVQFDSKESTNTSHVALLAITLANAGPAGAIGPAGPAGPTGATGASGAVGPAGAAGPMGSTGSQGPSGAIGPQGPMGATGPQGPAGSAGTGAVPAGIQYNVSGHTGTAIWNSPSGPAQQVTLNGLVATYAPTDCTPSMTIVSSSGASTTWVVLKVTPSTSSATWSVASTTPAASCSTTAGSPTCTTTGSSVTKGTYLTIASGSGASPAAPGGGGFEVAFSCQ